MRISTAGIYGSLLLAAAAQVNAGMVDAKLLDMLKANGQITAAQHAELSADLAREQRKEKQEAKELVKEKDFVAFRQAAGWAAKTTFTGDMRVRNETIDLEGQPDAKDKDRQRLRARLGAITKVNPEVEAGIQVATGNSGDRRSTNQDMDGYFDKKSVWLDLGYINYNPVQVPGLKTFAGKMKQPWMSVADAMWDGDINPEGFAASYKKNYGTTTVFGSGGYYVLDDNVDGEGVAYDHDLNLWAFQVGAGFDMGDSVRMTAGLSVNEFGNESQPLELVDDKPVALRGNGNTTDRFQLWELFGQMDVIGLPLPLSLYGQYIQNTEARDLVARSEPDVAPTFYDGGSEDTAWVFGIRTNIAGIALDYNYRDVEANGVVGTLTDSDFAAGYTNSSGHKLKAQYDFLTNFNIALTYFMAESDAASKGVDDAEVDTFHVDLNAKF